MFRAMAWGLLPVIVIASCSDSSESDGSADAGDAGQGGQSAGSGGSGSKAGGDAAAAGSPDTAGAAASAGAPDVAGAAGNTLAGAGGATGGSANGGAANGGAGDAGAAGRGAGDAGAADGGATGCAALPAMPPSPLAPADPVCGSGCSVPPMDGIPLTGACASLGSTPPASATVDPEGQPASGVGWPCDDGWCASHTVKIVTIGQDDLNGPFYEQNSISAAPSDTVHVARAQNSYGFADTLVNTTGVVSVWDPLDPDTWLRLNDNVTPFYPDILGDVVGPVVKVDPRTGKHNAYLAYAGIVTLPFTLPGAVLSDGRFATLVGSDWVFEDFPPGWEGELDIQIDADGSALMLQGGRVYRHVAEGGFSEVATPCGAHATSLATDPSTGVWLLLDAPARTLYQRAANGDWSSEHVPVALRVINAGGTAHLLTPTGVIHRSGTAWSVPIGASVNPTVEGWTAETSVTVDACWAPHVTYPRDYDPPHFLHEIDYARWTARGFLIGRIAVSGDFPHPVIAVTANDAFFTGEGKVYVVPLR